ncbi:MAG: NUDIX hydrolase [Parachlamydiaceae bacterium]
MTKFLLCFVLLIAKLPAIIYLEPTPQFKPRFEVATVYIEYNGQILLLHRQNDKSQGNKWGIPGGKVEKNETPLQAAIREVKEETGMDISGQDIETIKAVYVEYDEKINFVYHAFRTQLQGNPVVVKINFDEHKGFTWVAPADALKMDLLQDEDACLQKDYFNLEN